MSGGEAIARFACFGSSCAVFVTGACEQRSAREAVAHCRRSMLAWHARFSRFSPESELSLLNRDPRTSVPASALMAQLAAAVRRAGAASGGLIDATLLEQIESAGYSGDMRSSLPLADALRLAPPRRSAGPRVRALWELVEVDSEQHVIVRPPGLKIDPGGIAKGLFADVLTAQLSGHASFAVDCGGDLMLGGADAVARAIEVESPFDGSTLHTFSRAHTGVATSGIGKRAWLDVHGSPAHHLLDPSCGRPAFTGVVQATALAPSALMAEVYAKAAVLSGPAAARRWLRHGGVIVLDDGSFEVIEPPAAAEPRCHTRARARARAESHPRSGAHRR
jgi:FAD:protein FMN transferase